MKTNLFFNVLLTLTSLKRDENKLRNKNKSLLVPLVFIFVFTFSFMIQGSVIFAELNPPASAVDGNGNPVSTMKTLQQVEPRTPISDLPYIIDASGSYYLTSDLTGTADFDGIRVNVSDVTIDLNGYTLTGNGGTSGDGIRIYGNLQNIHIYNGTVTGWPKDGIDAISADNSIFENLSLSHNETDGLVTDYSCIIINCTANNNNLDGLEGDDGTIIKNSTAFENIDNGIQISEGSLVLDSTSYKNTSDGFDIAAGSLIRRCVARDNGIMGFDIALSCSAIACTATLNGWRASGDPNAAEYGDQPQSANGFDFASACIIRDCISSLNKGNGFRGFSNGWIIGNKAHENALAGINCRSSDTQIEGNQSTNNGHPGIQASSSGSLIFGNRATGNGTNDNATPPGENNYDIITTTTYGPIVSPGSGDISGTANSNHPMANFEY